MKGQARTQARKRKRQDAADKREEARMKRTPKQQLAKLDKKLGKGKGAVKERKRLNG